MGAKVDQTSSVEPHAVKMSVATTTSASGPKHSMFAAKSGFVIPKNKLSGSLVPIFRGGKKLGVSDVVNEEIPRQVQRKTKWGPDLTQDASVRRGRALAYQTRVDQITQQLKLENMELEDNQKSPLTAQIQDEKSSTGQFDSEKPELLELEKQEAIGEILKLNPSYKAPPDYKPLLKEARVPIPVKDYPGYNFVALIYGSGSDTKKRLEKETGAKIQLYGTKAVTGEKGEITPSDGNDIHGAFEELYVAISADTFEKADAAVALIELLLTSIPGNLAVVSTTSTTVSGDNVNAFGQNQDAATPYIPPAVNQNQGVMQPTQTLPQNQFQYPSSWFPSGPPQTPMHLPSRFGPPPNFSAPILRSSIHPSSSPYNSSTVPSLYGPRPTPEVGFNLIPQKPSLVAQRPHLSQMTQHPYMPQTHPMGPPISAPHTISPAPFTGNQIILRGPPQISRPLLPPLSGSLIDRALTPAGWPGAPPVVPASLGPSSMVQTISATNVVSPMSFTSGPSTSAAPSAFLRPEPVSIPNSSRNHVLGFTSMSSPVPSMQPSPLQSGMPGSLSGSIPNFPPMKPLTGMAPKPHHPSSGDFTFQPHQLQSSASQVGARPSSIPAAQSLMMQRPAPQTPSFHLSVPSSTPQPATQIFPRPQVSIQLGQSQPQSSPGPFGPNPMAISNPPRLPPFINAAPNAPPHLVPQMGPRNFIPPSQVPNMAGPFPPRSLNHGQLEQHYPAHTTRPAYVVSPNQQFSSNRPFVSGNLISSPRGQQIYDPFLPTSVPVAPQQQGANQAKVKKQDNDPEYEDLMASVGVK